MENFSGSAKKIFSKDFNEITGEIESYFLDEPGPAILPESRDSDKNISGMIVPEDKYETSGYAMAWAYKEIAETKFKKTYIIIGYNREENSYVITGDVKTPLGFIKYDRDMTIDLKEKTGISTKSPDELDDSILLQLPFLQYASKDRLSDTKIMMIELGKAITIEQMKILKHFIREIIGKDISDIGVIASSSLLRYGDKFGSTPFIYNVRESIENVDYRVIKYIEENRPEDVMKSIEKNIDNIRGYKAITLLMLLLEDYDAKLLQYYNSSTIDKDENNSTSYLSMKFLKDHKNL